ncbi:hypothetical protein BC833DRAFT_405578, partial [Globomyces pollinis-pini]
MQQDVLIHVEDHGPRISRLSILFDKPIFSTKTITRVGTTRHHTSSDISPLLLNSNRLKKISEMREKIINGLFNCNIASYRQNESEAIHPNSPYGLMKAAKMTFIYEVGQTAETWIYERFEEVSKFQKQLRKGLNTMSICKSIENHHWGVLCDDSRDFSEDEINEQLWNRYMVGVEQTETTMPNELDSEYEMVISDMRLKAAEHFENVFLSELSKGTPEDVIKGLYYSTKFSTGTAITNSILSKLIQLVSTEILREKVIPRFLLLCTFSVASFGDELMEFILEQYIHLVTEDAIASVLEYSTHIPTSKSWSVIFRLCSNLLTLEALLTGYLSASASGNENSCSAIQLRLLELIESQDSGGDRFKAISPNNDPNDFVTYIAPCTYVFLATAAATTHSQHCIIYNLITLIDDASIQSALANGGITKLMHQRFKDGLFNMASELNHSNVVSILAENNWLPVNLKPAVYQAVNQGHQKILHFLLELLLSPDPKIKTVSSAIPLYFRKSNVLRTLPYIASRFPQEASWFLDEMSYIPIPACVPISSDRDALVRPKLVKGIQ